MDDQISDAQAAAERLALVVSAYYSQLVREHVPQDVAQILAYKYQADLMHFAFYAPQAQRSDDDAAAASTSKS